MLSSNYSPNPFLSDLQFKLFSSLNSQELSHFNKSTKNERIWWVILEDVLHTELDIYIYSSPDPKDCVKYMSMVICSLSHLIFKTRGRIGTKLGRSSIYNVYVCFPRSEFHHRNKSPEAPKSVFCFVCGAYIIHPILWGFFSMLLVTLSLWRISTDFVLLLATVWKFPKQGGQLGTTPSFFQFYFRSDFVRIFL